MKRFTFIFLVAAASVTAGCTSTPPSSVGSGGGSALPRVSTWTCTDNNSITIRNEGGSVLVTDTRGVDTDLPADPPGQRTRYGKTGFALVMDGRTASWFVSGKRPADCRR